MYWIAHSGGSGLPLAIAVKPNRRTVSHAPVNEQSTDREARVFVGSMTIAAKSPGDLAMPLVETIG
jgi:hypothetical protein